MRDAPRRPGASRFTPFWRRLGWRAAAALLGAGLLLGVTPGAAAADVVLQPDHTEAGAEDVRVSFEVRNDDPADPVVGVRVDLPSARPLEGVTVPPVAGWQATISPGSIEWRGGPAGAEPVELAMVVGRMPEGAGPVRFRVLQTSRSGAVVEWSDRSTPGAPPPAHRSLVLPFGVPEPRESTQPSAPVQAHDHGQQARDAAGALPDSAGPDAVWWTIGGALALAGLLAALAAGLGRRQRARFAALTGESTGRDSAD